MQVYRSVGFQRVLVLINPVRKEEFFYALDRSGRSTFAILELHFEDYITLLLLDR